MECRKALSLPTHYVPIVNERSAIQFLMGVCKCLLYFCNDEDEIILMNLISKIERTPRKNDFLIDRLMRRVHDRDDDDDEQLFCLIYSIPIYNYNLTFYIFTLFVHPLKRSY